ncbi:MAG: hypothetical protein KGO92_04510 [Bacteroidota bacterium]|nr:hypothetical protein [Bacteroidota bacterium]
MKNKLEDFVKRNRDAFDSENPSPHIWEAIEQTPEKKEKKILYYFSRMQAAAILLLLLNGMVIFFLLQYRTNGKTEPASGMMSQPVAGQEIKVSEDMLSQFSKAVEKKQERLKEVASTNPVLYKKFTDALNQLNTVYKDLENELEHNPNKEQLLEVMIQNLSLQQELLNQQLSIYQKIKNNKNETFIKNM